MVIPQGRKTEVVHGLLGKLLDRTMERLQMTKRV